MASAGRGRPTGILLPKSGGRRHASDGHGQPDQELEAPRVSARANSTGLRVEYLEDLAPHTADLANRSGQGRGPKLSILGRSRRANDQGTLPANSIGLVRPGTEEARGRARKKLESGRRTRLDPGTGRLLAVWLHRVARCHAHLCAIVRLFGRPDRAGGQSNLGDTYAERAARGDRTILYDAITVTVDELVAVREEIQREMDAATATEAAPGTPDKVRVMALRAERGESLFIGGDGPTGPATDRQAA
jgi:hypothetical protein